MDPRNILKKKYWNPKIQREKIWDPQNTHEQKFRTNEIPTGKKFGFTK